MSNGKDKKGKEEYDVEWVKEAGSYDKYLIPKEFGNLYPNKKKKATVAAKRRELRKKLYKKILKKKAPKAVDIAKRKKPRSMKKGGTVKETGIYKLHKGEKVVPVKKNITDRIKRVSGIQKEALKNVKKRMEVETPDVYFSKNRNWRKLTQDEKDDMYGRRQGTISMIKERSRESSPEEEKLVTENLRLKKLEAKKAWKEYHLKKTDKKKVAKKLLKKKTTKTLARRPTLPR